MVRGKYFWIWRREFMDFTNQPFLPSTPLPPHNELFLSQSMGPIQRPSKWMTKDWLLSVASIGIGFSFHGLRDGWALERERGKGHGESSYSTGWGRGVNRTWDWVAPRKQGRTTWREKRERGLHCPFGSCVWSLLFPTPSLPPLSIIEDMHAPLISSSGKLIRNMTSNFKH